MASVPSCRNATRLMMSGYMHPLRKAPSYRGFPDEVRIGVTADYEYVAVMKQVRTCNVVCNAEISECVLLFQLESTVP